MFQVGAVHDFDVLLQSFRKVSYAPADRLYTYQISVCHEILHRLSLLVIPFVMLPVHFQSSRRLDLDRRLNLTSRQQVQIPKLESLFLILDDPDSGTLPRRIIIVDRTAVRDHPLEQAERGFPDFGTGRAEHGGEVLRGWVVQAANDACRWEEFFLQAEDAFVGDAHVSDDGRL